MRSDWTIKSKYPPLAYTQPVKCFLCTVIGSLISEYPGYSLISDRDSARDCLLMNWVFLKGLFLTDSLVGYMLTLLFTSVLMKAQDIPLTTFTAR